ncbi:MAG: PEGA domain-containing protein [Treponema sp.]|nr:PEGA domain-containing protein [Treponema sp.]
MKQIPLFLFIIVFFLFPSDVFTQSGGQSVLTAENNILFDDNRTSITINANIQDASVYLNGEYQGRTPCTITDLGSGSYNLSVKKNGYGERSYRISVKSGQSSTFFVELDKITGFVLLSGISGDSLIYTDGDRLSATSLPVFGSPLELEEGFHTITVRRFGYNDYTTQVFVSPHLIIPVQIQMTKASFAISEFSAGRRRFNPAYTGAVGSCTFSFKVTAPETGTLTIADSAGTTVFTWQFPEFSTWEQGISWNGRDTYGKELPDGFYRATVTAGNFTQTAYTQIDHSLTYHPADVTKSGTGTGTLPAAFIMAEDTSYIGTEVSPVFRSDGTPFYETPVNIFFGMAPVSWFEFSMNFELHAGIQNAPLSVGGAVKLGSSQHINTDTKLCYAAVFRYGYTNETPLYEPYGADTGNGLGGGTAIGFDNSAYYAGISSEYLYGTLQGNLKINDSIWRNGIGFEYRPSQAATLKAWFALNSAFGETTGTAWLRAFDTGAGATIQLGNSSVMLNIKGDSILYPGSTNYFSGTFGLTYLF